jgi:signal transduction histidine kinase
MVNWQEMYASRVHDMKASEIRDAALRVSGLVTAVKGFTHMDQSQVAGPVDVGRSLEDTVTMFRSKSRAKSVAITVDLEPGLPAAIGFAGELNQVWANLIENALDAVSESGRVDVIARREPGRVVVRVVDNGSGIPSEHRGKIFEPFFTTKPVGVGTGLGLDIARRHVRHNDGTIEFESRPGRT